MNNKGEKIIKINKDGPYSVFGGIPLDEQSYVADENGASLEYKKEKEFPIQEEYNLCRCGKSKNKPFCDGTHVDIGFNGTETADNKNYLDIVKAYEGKEVDLLDGEEYCAGARFCDAYRRAWEMIINPLNSNETQLGIGEAFKCPGGRLTIVTKEGQIKEPELEEEISALSDPFLGVRGPLQIKGGIQIIGFDGKKYEIRNRVTLCRCGKSQNKPFCDGSHIQDKYEGNGL